MTSKTPQFDRALDNILKNLKPYTRACQQCGKEFNIVKEDIEFYNKLRVPPPTFCNSCRLQRRLAYRVGFLIVFYKRTCSAPDHNEKIVSFYSEQNPVKVYDDNYYHSDKWDAFEYGRDYDFTKSFFSQFNQLALIVPHQSLQKDPKGVDCDYAISGVSSKNCYYVSIPYYSENVYYAYLPVYSRNCIDVRDVDNSEQCYKSVYLNHCYNCSFCYECVNCIDSYFLYDCKNCQNCFGCTNLRNKKYCFFNKQLSKKEYERQIKAINLGKRTVLRDYVSQFDKVFQKAIRKNVDNVKVENCYGDKLRECKNCFYCFRVFGGSENLRYIFSADKLKESMDVYGASKSSLLYESTACVFANSVKFSIFIRTSLEIEYCVECNNCEYCFGCFGLRNKRYCIFNKQYSEKEYWNIVDKIKTKMLEHDEYGEPFPVSMSLIPYKDSNASVEFPLTKEEIIKNKWYWQEDLKGDLDLSKFKVLDASKIPDDISEVSDDILNSAIICEQTDKPFRITKFELDFYRKKNIPIPTIHPFQRINNLFSFVHPFMLWQSICSKCGKQMYSSYNPEKKLNVYCEACYQQEVV